ncbi:hypothetical protein LOAG_12959 [Loa loa]|uniref:Secreted protein n=1 Tax=Loa loa TaxID=7209 RepID=A0A1I7VTZ1_LOALO|nr:hypothetical protein LOAG_12959 [Loa loa]EFO15550.1 hypothetical protein LOAG_12959 [Loa loa]
MTIVIVDVGFIFFSDLSVISPKERHECKADNGKGNYAFRRSKFPFTIPACVSQWDTSKRCRTCSQRKSESERGELLDDLKTVGERLNPSGDCVLTVATSLMFGCQDFCH